jgi:ribosomal protein S17
MQKTVKVRIGTQDWNSHIRKVPLSLPFPLSPSLYPPSRKLSQSPPFQFAPYHPFLHLPSPLQPQPKSPSHPHPINPTTTLSPLLNSLTPPPPQHFNRTTNLLVHDPRSSLRLGDIIAIEPGWRVSKHVHHVVAKIIAPFGEPIEARPPVPSFEERVEERERRRAEKEARRAARRVQDGGEDNGARGGEGESEAAAREREREAGVREAREAELA